MRSMLLTRSAAYWEVALDSVFLGDDELELENTGAAIDTGASCSALLCARPC